MKIYKKLVIGGIETKIFNLILLTIILLSGTFLALTLSQSKLLSFMTAETSVRQQETTSSIISDAMNQVTRRSMENTTKMEAKIVDEMFRGVQARVMLVSDYATKLFANPEDYPAKPYSSPDATLDGQLAAQIIWAGSTDPADPAIAERVGLVSNLSEMMISLCEATGTDNIYVGLPEGFFLSVNRTSADWFGQDGEVLDYDPRTRFWYKQAVDAGDLVFSDLEVDATTGEMSVVCAMPVYSPDGALAGVVGSDLFLHAMEQDVQGLVTDGGYSWIVNRDGHVIYSPNPELMQLNESAYAVDLRKSENKELADLLNDAMSGGTDVRVVTVNGEALYMQGVPIETVGWTLFSAFPKETVDQVEVALLDSYDRITSEARATYQDNIRMRGRSTIILLGLLTIACIGATIAVSKHIVKPLNTITDRIASISEQNWSSGWRTVTALGTRSRFWPNPSPNCHTEQCSMWRR